MKPEESTKLFWTRAGEISDRIEQQNAEIDRLSNQSKNHGCRLTKESPVAQEQG